MWHPLFWRLSLSLWIAYLFHFRHLAAGSDRFVVLVQALVERGTISLADYVSDPFYQSFLIDVFTYGDRPLLNINPGISFLAAPAWALVYPFYRLLPDSSPLRQDAIHFLLAHFVSCAIATALLSALTAWLLAAFTYQRSGSLSRAVCAALLYGLGSIAFFFSTRLNQNIAIAFIAVAVFVLLFEPGLLSARSRSVLEGFSPRWSRAAIGFLLAWGWFIDVTSVPLTVAAVGMLLWRKSLAETRRERRPWLQLGWVAAGALPPLASQLAYNYAAFGNPLLPTTVVLARVNAAATGQAALGVAGIEWLSIGQYLIGTEAGLFVYMPYALLSAYYGLRYWREQRCLRRTEKVALSIGFVLYLLFIGTIPANYLYSLFGPRYLLPVVPFVALLFSLYVRRCDLQLAAILVGLAGWVNLAGAQLGNDTGNALLTAAVYSIKGPWLPILDWLQANLADATGFDPSFVNPLGLLLALTGCLAAIWLPYWLQARRPAG